MPLFVFAHSMNSLVVTALWIAVVRAKPPLNASDVDGDAAAATWIDVLLFLARPAANFGVSQTT